MKKIIITRLKQILLTTSISIVSVPVLIYGGLLVKRPLPTDKHEQLFQGIVYQRDARNSPRPLMVHTVTIDLSAPGIKLLVTPGNKVDKNEFSARTTSEFVREFKLQLAINGSFFYPFRQYPPNSYPKTGNPVIVQGQVISEGKSYAPPKSTSSVLCISKFLQAEIYAQIYQSRCPPGTSEGLAGREILLKEGKPAVLPGRKDENLLCPRTAVAIDKSGKTLWLIIVDGRQQFYSEGVTLAELTTLIKELGADSALNLDGGGSSTLVVANKNKLRVLNSPIQTRIPTRQRPVANHMGIYALPVENRE
ncbi:MAG: phosphodiester glycosidase family protein [Moorea sp. SIOASIH]|uniref:phosphodiester glycosidase family protein n=1 Tax=Moorena sp. SIOASIH TaxID=2607817 RepID=UPI0013B9DC79|nr:phosphodiester glycosidase family protein [Moorena sp. SIOASIH]NEO36225.1 phosphodiester glycosidase family protein [Moorena sp. SIOASIH]